MALGDPVGDPEYQLAGDQREHNKWLFLVDVSASMGVRDSGGEKSRLESAKGILKSLVPQLKWSPSALSAFTSETMILSPLTLDHLFVQQMVDQIEINEGGTEGTDIESALKTGFKSGVSRIVLFSDGGEEAVKVEVPENVLLIVVGVGTPQGGKIPGYAAFSTLNEKALKGLGEKYIAVEDTSSVLIAERVMEMVGDSPDVSPKGLVLRPYYKYPLSLAIVFILAYLYFPRRVYA